jgi:hypothetical protein
MKQKFANALSLALIVAMLLTSVALADNVINDVVAGGNDTITSGGSTVINYQIKNTNAQNSTDPQNSCNAADSTPATVTVNTPAGVTVDTSGAPGNQATLVFTSCETNKSATFSSSTPGDYTITVSVTDTGAGTYNTNPATFTLHVLAPAKTTPTITWANPADITYGTALGAAQLNATASVAGTFTYTPAADTVLNAGNGQTLHVDFVPDDTSLYNNASKNVTINVLKADPGCNISGYSGVYDGNAHGASGSCSGEGTLDLGASFTDVPGGVANWSYTGDSNYNGASGSVEIDITQAPSMVTITCPASVVYNAAAQTPCSAKASGAGMDDVTLSVSYSNNTNAGMATASASWDGDANHTGNSATKDFTIEQADATCAVSGYSGVYDTAFHGATGSCSGIGGENAGTLDLGASFKDVPGGTANWSFTGNGNYKNQTGSVAIEITKADATCSISGYTGVFDGAPHGATGSCSGIGGENAGSLNLGDTFTMPPGGTANWTFTGNGNYKDQSGSVAISIAAWTLNGFYAPVDMNGVYNTVKAGSTVPLKFEIFAGSTELTATSAVSSLNAARVSCTPGTEDAIELTATGGTSLRYDTTSGQFIYNWKTPTGAGLCYKVTMTTADGSSLVAFFKTK